MANTNAFSMRRKNKDLRAKYRTVLDKLAGSSSKKQTAYEEYLVRLNEIITHHYAELNEEGDVIRKWDTTSTETRYYLKKEG